MAGIQYEKAIGPDGLNIFSSNRGAIPFLHES